MLPWLANQRTTTRTPLVIETRTATGEISKMQRRRAWHQGWLLGISEATARCKHCGSFELRRDVASGAVDCVDCGEGQDDD